jgi:Sec-independent protein translocase protein TatA
LLEVVSRPEARARAPAPHLKRKDSRFCCAGNSLLLLDCPNSGIVAAVFLVGAEKLGELVKDSGKTAGELKLADDELKNVPGEFQKGMEEGEQADARCRKAKQMKPVDDDNTNSNE